MNPVEESGQEFDYSMEYPRAHIYNHSEEVMTTAEVLTTRWQLDNEDLLALHELVGTEVVGKDEVTVKLGYSNHREWDLEFDESKIIPFLVSKISEISEELKHDALGFSTLQELYDYLTSEDELDEEEELLEFLDNHFPDNDPHPLISKLLDNLLPRFLYFSKYETLQGKVSANEILPKIGDEASQTESERIFWHFLISPKQTSCNYKTLVAMKQEKSLKNVFRID